MDEYYQRNNKAKHNHMREDGDSSRGLDTCEDFVHLVLSPGMDHI